MHRNRCITVTSRRRMGTALVHVWSSASLLTRGIEGRSAFDEPPASLGRVQERWCYQAFFADPFPSEHTHQEHKGPEDRASQAWNVISHHRQKKTAQETCQPYNGGGAW